MAPAAGTSLAALIGVEVWFTPPAATARSARIRGVRPGPKGPLVAFEGVTDGSAARVLCGSELLVRTADVPPEAISTAEEPDDVTGYTMTDADHGLIGEIVDTIVTGANDVWVVDGPFGEVLVPVIKDVVLAIDDDERTVSVALLDGLLPEEGESA